MFPLFFVCKVLNNILCKNKPDAQSATLEICCRYFYIILKFLKLIAKPYKYNDCHVLCLRIDDWK